MVLQSKRMDQGWVSRRVAEQFRQSSNYLLWAFLVAGVPLGILLVLFLAMAITLLPVGLLMGLL